MPIYFNGAAYRIDARLKYRIREGKLTLWYELIRPEKIIEDARKANDTKLREESERRLAQSKETQALFTRIRETTWASLTSLLLQQADLPPALLESQLRVWRAANTQAEFELLRSFAGLFVAEVNHTRTGRTVNTEPARRRLTAALQ